MRKTFLKVALIGLLVGSLPVGFTSCKDYDDDIEQTNNQVADLKTKLASVETAIAALPSKADVTAAQAAAVAQAKADLEAVQAKLQAAIDGKADKEAVEAINTELSSIKGQLETLEALKAEVGSSLEAINGSIDELKADAESKGQMIAGIQAQIAELTQNGTTQFTALTEELNALKTTVNDPTSGVAALKAQIEELAQKINGEGGDATSLEAVVRLMNGMITHIEVVTEGDEAFENTALGLFIVDVAEDYVFGQGLPGEITFTKGKEMMFADSLLVRVSPANAVVSADQIQLVNSKGEDVSDFITVTEVKPYAGLLSRSIANNGLHVVKFELKKEYDRDAYKAATTTEDEKQVLFAVAIADSEKELADNRDITSAYNVTITSAAYDPEYTLNYTVNEEAVANIHNRFVEAEGDGSSFAYANNLVTEWGTTAKTWAIMDEAYDLGQDVVELADGFTNVGDYCYSVDKKGVISTIWANTTDNRQDKAALAVELGKKFTVDLGDEVPGIYGFYVALDLDRATESNGSERTAWQAYESQISGINKVVNGTSIDLCLNMKEVEAGEEIGFRVWAVNYNGTLVDPDGRAFYVKVGESEVEAQGEVSFALTATTTKDITLATAVDGSAELAGDWMNKYTSVTAEFAVDADQEGCNGEVSINLNGKTIDDGETVTLSRNASTGYNAYFKKMNIVLSNANFADGVEYTGKLTIKANGSTVQTIAIKFVKNIPTTMPADAVTPKPGQVKDGKIEAYVGTATTFDLNNVFTFKAGAPLTETVVYSATSKSVAENGVIEFASTIVNNNKYYALNIVYTYADVSYVWDEDANDGDGAYVNEPVEIAADPYQISFNTLTNAYNFAWNVKKINNKDVSMAPALVQGEELKDFGLDAIYVTSSMQVNIKNTLKELIEDKTVKIVDQEADETADPKQPEIKVYISGDLEDYFTVAYTANGFVFTPVENTNPVGQISGKLNIPYQGEDGITCWKSLDLTMNAPQN